LSDQRRVSGLNSPRFEGSVAWRDAQTAAMFDVPYTKAVLLGLQQVYVLVTIYLSEQKNRLTEASVGN